MWSTNIERVRKMMVPACMVLAMASTGSLQAKGALKIPGLIQAESYDTGGEGVGFHLASPDTRKVDFKLRPDAARLYAIPAGGHAVELLSGDWLNYTATVKQDGLYTLTFKVAHGIGDDPLFRVECDGKDITGILNAPFTGGLDTWVTLSRPMLKLSAGKHVFTVRQTGGTPFYLDALTFTAGGTVKPGPAPDLSRWDLVWSDEFEYTGQPDPTKWSYDIGGHGWGNKEQQYYTDRRENSRVENGHLVIEAKRETFKENPYTSARLVTRGKGDFIHGRFEIRAKLPAGAGTWPAIWLLGSNGKPWPACGEIDIMEHLGNNPGWIHGSTHSQKYFFKNGNQKTSITYLPDTDKEFHLYAIEWFEDRIDFFVDNNRYLTVKNEKSGWEAWPFEEPQHLILNVALGGWGGIMDEKVLPVRMEVDYVRVYKQKK